MTTRRIDLTRIPAVKFLLVNRWPQFILRTVALAGFLVVILAGWLGTPVGSRNLSIVFVWIGWWALLILALVPLLGRGWCAICPIPMAGEWLQQGSLLGPNPQRPGWGMGRPWPRRLRNIWLQNGGFTLLALTSAVVLTQPQVTAVILAAFLFIAVGVSLVFERRAFCRYLCPVGGFIGLYAQTAPIELRVRDTAVCAGHTDKTCYTGSAAGYGCPWDVFPGGIVKNNNCGLCMECLRTCPHDNIAIQIRPVGEDLTVSRGRKPDEAYKAFIMLGSALTYSAVMLGPWGWLKSTAYQIGSLEWMGYAATFLLLIFGLLPGLFYLAVWAGRRGQGSHRQTRQRFTAYAYALIPLGLSAWIAFSLAFVFTNLSYIWPVLSDPFGWGWDLWGTAAVSWTPYLTGFMPPLQLGVLVAGLGGASWTAEKIRREKAGETAVPVILYCFLLTTGLLWLLIG
ncbi:MAG: 4Fe-4S binding protein [Anaerolinea sp.]|nr:4Fe-4S binding protein [Anaerolinea sp.]